MTFGDRDRKMAFKANGVACDHDCLADDVEGLGLKYFNIHQ
jgi:hypothetical protein